MKSIDFSIEEAIGIALGGFAVLVACVIIICVAIYCCWKKSRRRRYERLRTNQPRQSIVTSIAPASQRNRGGPAEEGLYAAMQRERLEQEATRRETGLLNCQFYLRSNQKYVMETHLPDIGSRISKNWYMVRSIGATQNNPSQLLTMIPISQQCRLNLQSSDKHIMNNLLKVIEHPCIHNVSSIDYIPDKRIIVILEPFKLRGSLKDLIYQTTPSLSWATKYSVRRLGLRVSQIQNYGRQILEAVSFLHDLGLNPLGQIQTGNIYIEGTRCKLSGLDNSLLGYKPRIFRIIKQFRDDIDSVMFGHLLFEIASGAELSTSIPIEGDYRIIKIPEVVQVLQFIFQTKLPSIAEILQLEFFQNVRVSATLNHEGVLLDEDMNALIYKSRKGRSRPLHVSKRKKDQASSSSYTEDVYPSRSSYSSSIVASSVPKPPLSSTSTEGTRDRSVLLSDIQRGRSLRHSVTSDRSAPLLK